MGWRQPQRLDGLALSILFRSRKGYEGPRILDSYLADQKESIVEFSGARTGSASTGMFAWAAFATPADRETDQ